MIDIEELLDETSLFLEPRSTFDRAIVGVAKHGPKSFVVCYSIEKIVRALIADGMAEDEAIEHVEFNVTGGWLGEGTPIFLMEKPKQPYRPRAKGKGPARWPKGAREDGR